MNVDFSQLATPQMIDVLDYETLFAERKQRLLELWSDPDERQAIADILQRESEPLTKLLQENTYRELLLRHRINQASLANLLAFATGSDLDAVASNFDVKRLTITPATDRQPAIMESDLNLRSRVQMKFDSLSTAGPENSYKYHAFSADGRVADVSVISPSPAFVTVSILQKDSEKNIASSELIQIVEQALNAEDVRPIGDRVTVQSASIIDYDIDADLVIGKDPQTATLLENAQRNIEQYINEQKRIGRSIYRSAIYAELHIKGVDNVIIRKPAQDVILTATQASFCNNIKLKTVLNT